MIRVIESDLEIVFLGNLKATEDGSDTAMIYQQCIIISSVSY